MSLGKVQELAGEHLKVRAVKLERYSYDRTVSRDGF